MNRYQIGRHLSVYLLLFFFCFLSTTKPAALAQTGGARGPILVGVASFSPPFASEAPNGQIVGFDVELLKTVARTAGLSIHYEAVPFRELIPGVATNLYDAAIGCIFVTESRKALVDFSTAYFTTGTVLAFAENNAPIYALSDLTTDVAVSVSAGSTAAELVREETGAEMLSARSQQQALEWAAEGVADVALVDEMAVATFAQSDLDANLVVASGLVTMNQCAIAVNKSNPQLLLELNTALIRLQNSGKYQTIYNRWFGDRPLTGPHPLSTPIANSLPGTLPPIATSTGRTSESLDIETVKVYTTSLSPMPPTSTISITADITVSSTLP